jgi:phage terminase large subunit GpA-like protein
VAGEAPEHMRLYERREHYDINTCPPGVLFLTAGCDVQKDRLEVEIVGWGRGKESWSIDYRVIMGETHTEAPWVELDKIMNETWSLSNGSEAQVRVLAVDSGFNTQHVYNWTRKYPKNRVIPVKGSDTISTILGHPKDADISRTGKKVKNAVKVWSVGVSQLKTELYGFLSLNGAGDDGQYPPGFCHFPQYNEEHFRRLTAEELRKKKVNGNTVYYWHKKFERNEQLDVRNYSRAGANFFGMDRFKERDWEILEGKHSFQIPQQPAPVEQVPQKSTPNQNTTTTQKQPHAYWGNNRNVWKK